MLADHELQRRLEAAETENEECRRQILALEDLVTAYEKENRDLHALALRVVAKLEGARRDLVAELETARRSAQEARRAAATPRSAGRRDTAHAG